MRQILYIFLFLVFFFGILSAHAQMPFHQVTQVPLLVNPSLAGSKVQKRIAMAGNFYFSRGTIKETQTRSALFSYDQLIKKLGTGVGLYFLHHRFHYKNPIWQDDYLTDFSEFSLGLAFAPKYNVYQNKNSFGKVKFTISPSVLLEYSPNRRLLTNHDSVIPRNNLYASWSPYPMPFGSDSIQTANVRLNTRTFRAGVGLQINTEKFMILYKMIHETENTDEHASVTIMETSTDQTTSVKVDLHQRYYSINQTLNLGKTFSSLKNWFSFTPFLGFGIRHYLNVIPYRGERDLYKYYYSKSQKDSNKEGSYAHLSLNFRTGKFLFGTAFTSDFKYHNNFGGTIGFQSKSVRIMSSWGFPTYKISGELSANIYF